MTLDQRIGAAARSVYEAGGQDWSRGSDGVHAFEIEQARRYAEALFPELFSDPPRAWLAPKRA